MVFVWRGAGILVPIFFFISAWITSYWFEDTRFGNTDYLGWTLLWSGIVCTILGALLSASNMEDPDTGEEPKEKTYYDFFWIPMVFWGIGFVGLSIYLLNFTGGDEKSEEIEYAGTYAEQLEDQEEHLDYGKRILHFYNATNDSIDLKMLRDGAESYSVDTWMAPKYCKYIELTPDDYQITMDELNGPLSIPASDFKTKEYIYDEAWLILGNGIDFMLVDVTNACRKDINEDELRAIEWTNKVRDMYDGEYLIEPAIKVDSEKTLTVIGPYLDLPLEHESDELVYALIPIKTNGKFDREAYLDDYIYEVCF